MQSSLKNYRTPSVYPTLIISYNAQIDRYIECRAFDWTLF